jgi:DNA-directed RNA polymerase subunit RPC12/RpoP
MARSDYYRPSESQIRHHYKCSTCGAETEIESCYSADACHCGGRMQFSGESYPADSREWNEERDTVDGEWHSRR